MKFWDSSALVPLVADEPKTDVVNAIIAKDRYMLVAFITPVEVESAVWRKARQMRNDLARQRSHHRLAAIRGDWVVIDDYGRVLKEAGRMVARYGLRGADAIQLACAIVGRPPAVLPFVTLDEELAAAARAEGFPILP
ncbi:MAG TPA: type II toxin-antitoxin system VapC family toxin [Thermoanaerobaculia bacterium]|nr:type II toxin-antitoxin system VapC family toxin [Thermoanaerobaculia bacterium]